MNTNRRILATDRRKRKGFTDIWNDGLMGKIIVSFVVVIFGALLSWIAWSSVSIAKIPEAFQTKVEAKQLEERCQGARNRLESRICNKVNKVEAKVIRNEERWESVQTELKAISKGIGEINGKLSRSERRRND